MVTLPRPEVGRERSSGREPRHLLAGAFVIAIVVYLFAPVAVTVLFSFTTSPRLSLPIEGLTIEWYSKVFNDPRFIVALKNSAILAIGSSVVGVILGTMVAFGMVGMRARTRSATMMTSLLPAVLPPLILAVALALFFQAIGWPQGLLNAGIGHILLVLPFVVLTMNARLQTFDFSTLDAARDLGASPSRTFRDITFPLISSSVFGAALIAMALSLDSFVITWFNVGNLQTLPTLIWGLMRRGIDPSVNAVATATLVTLTALVILSNRVSRTAR
jgi:spermidine/putrescine transport system permease protein